MGMAKQQLEARRQYTERLSSAESVAWICLGRRVSPQQRNRRLVIAVSFELQTAVHVQEPPLRLIIQIG